MCWGGCFGNYQNYSVDFGFYYSYFVLDCYNYVMIVECLDWIFVEEGNFVWCNFVGDLSVIEGEVCSFLVQKDEKYYFCEN